MENFSYSFREKSLRILKASVPAWTCYLNSHVHGSSIDDVLL